MWIFLCCGNPKKLSNLKISINYLPSGCNQNPNIYFKRLRKFFRSESDPVFVAPIRLEIDWDAKKIFDVIENIKMLTLMRLESTSLVRVWGRGRSLFYSTSRYLCLDAFISTSWPLWLPPLPKKLKIFLYG